LVHTSASSGTDLSHCSESFSISDPYSQQCQKEWLSN